MNNIEKIKEIMKRSTNIEELIAAIKKDEISAIYILISDILREMKVVEK